ncbi:hypothetical protein HDE_05868 [Halotydeus destructor]|nr:hypothetical protein HDE_05868 [Halotydeus destructor]
MTASLITPWLIVLFVGTIGGQITWNKCKTVEADVFCLATKDKVVQKAGGYCFQLENCDTVLIGEETSSTRNDKRYTWTMVQPLMTTFSQNGVQYVRVYEGNFYFVPASYGMSDLWHETPDKVLIAKDEKGVFCSAIKMPNGKLDCVKTDGTGYDKVGQSVKLDVHGKKFVLTKFSSSQLISYSDKSSNTHFQAAVNQLANVRFVTKEKLNILQKDKTMILFNLTLVGEATLQNV